MNVLFTVWYACSTKRYETIRSIRVMARSREPVTPMTSLSHRWSCVASGYKVTGFRLKVRGAEATRSKNGCFGKHDGFIVTELSIYLWLFFDPKTFVMNHWFLQRNALMLKHFCWLSEAVTTLNFTTKDQKQMGEIFKLLLNGTFKNSATVAAKLQQLR